jgi:porin
MNCQATVCLACLLFVGSFFPTRPSWADQLHHPHARLSTETDKLPPGLPDPSIATSFPSYADSLGVRSALARKGITYGVDYTGDVLGNVSGGIKQSTHYAGLLEGYIDADFAKLVNIRGLTFHADFYQIHGTSITTENIESIVSVSNIEAFPSTRLHELWFEQSLYNGGASVRFGQLGADSDFLISEVATRLIASTFGWTTLSSDNLPYGGPIYPFASPGVRLALKPQDAFDLKLGVYDSNPAAPCAEGVDPGKCNEHGLDFRLNDPPLVLVEGAYSYGRRNACPSGTVKLGGWYDFGEFDDQRHPPGRGSAARGHQIRHRGNGAIYAVIDQQVLSLDGPCRPKGISVFARAIVSPADRNQVNTYADAGVVFTGLIPGHPDDGIALGVAYTGISQDASEYDRAVGLGVIRNYEFIIELNYIGKIAPGWAMQPVVQYIRNPGGSIPDVANGRPNQKIEDALVMGLRTIVNY